MVSPCPSLTIMVRIFSVFLGKFRLDQSERTVFPLINHIYFVCLCIGEYEKAVSQKLHLDAGILGEHGFDAKLFRADDADLVVLGSLLLGLDKLCPDAA